MSDPRGEARRRQRRRERLEGADACACCGFSDLKALVPTERSLVEDHHVVGRLRDDQEIVALCRNCHAVVTEENRDAGVPMKPRPNGLEEQAMKLRARGLFNIRQGKAQLRDAERLLDRVEELDKEVDGWREAIREPSDERGDEE